MFAARFRFQQGLVERSGSGASVQFFLVLDLQSKTWDGVTLFSLRQVVSWLGNVVPECDEHPKPGIASRSGPDTKIS
jgi:hypothetical protein